MIDYKPLFKTMIDKQITKTQLAEKMGSSRSTISKFSKNEYVSLEVIDRICKLLDCRIEDVIQYIPDKK